MTLGWPRLAALAGLALLSAPAAAAPISVTRSMTIVSDGVNGSNPRFLPGAVVEYTLMVQNPALNPQTIAAVTVCDDLPAGMAMRVADYGAAGSGPVEFAQGTLLGLLGSGQSYAYGGLGATGDGLTFLDAAGTGFTPAGTDDPRVRRVCVALGGTRMTTGGAFRLRYRAIVR